MDRAAALADVRPFIDFVEGRLEPEAFAAFLHEHPTIEQVLDSLEQAPPSANVRGSLYHYLLIQNFSSPGDVLNAHAALAGFLARHGVAARPTPRYRQLFQLLLAAQPRWLDVDDTFLQRELLPAAGGRTGPELKRWLRTELLKRFRYVGRPPRWIQSPRWPIGPNGPLVFLGQLPVKNYFHDTGAVYAFHDPVSGACESVVQIH